MPSFPGSGIFGAACLLCGIASTCWYWRSRAGSSHFAYPTNALMAQSRWLRVESEHPLASSHSMNSSTPSRPRSSIESPSGSFPRSLKKAMSSLNASR